MSLGYYRFVTRGGEVGHVLRTCPGRSQRTGPTSRARPFRRAVDQFDPDWRVFRSSAYFASYGFSTSGPGCSAAGPRRCGATLRSLKRAQMGRPLPLGSPVRAKFTQYDDIWSAIARSFSDAIDSFGDVESGYTRGAQRLLNA